MELKCYKVKTEFRAGYSMWTRTHAKDLYNAVGQALDEAKRFDDLQSSAYIHIERSKSYDY